MERDAGRSDSAPAIDREVVTVARRIARLVDAIGGVEQVLGGVEGGDDGDGSANPPQGPIEGRGISDITNSSGSESEADAGKAAVAPRPPPVPPPFEPAHLVFALEVASAHRSVSPGPGSGCLPPRPASALARTRPTSRSGRRHRGTGGRAATAPTRASRVPLEVPRGKAASARLRGAERHLLRETGAGAVASLTDDEVAAIRAALGDEQQALRDDLAFLHAAMLAEANYHEAAAPTVSGGDRVSGGDGGNRDGGDRDAAACAGGRSEVTVAQLRAVQLALEVMHAVM